MDNDFGFEDDFGFTDGFDDFDDFTQNLDLSDSGVDDSDLFAGVSEKLSEALENIENSHQTSENTSQILKKIGETNQKAEEDRQGTQMTTTSVISLKKQKTIAGLAGLESFFTGQQKSDTPENEKPHGINSIRNAMDFEKKSIVSEETPPIYTVNIPASPETEKIIDTMNDNFESMLTRFAQSEKDENGIKKAERVDMEKDKDEEPQVPEQKVYEKQRDYTNKIKKQAVTYRKPVERNAGGWKKVVIFLIACVAVGIFMGIKSSSYYLYKDGKVDSVLSCAWSWMMYEAPTILNRFNKEAFMAGFGVGAGALGTVGLFTWLDNDAKKASRVGHEHGNMQLAKPSDFKKYRRQFMDDDDNNMLFGVYQKQEFGLSLNNKKVNRSANVLVIGGTGTGKTFKYIKPNLLQENASVVVTDPSGDIFRSFAPYLLSKGYNVFLFNASDFSMSNHYNPLDNVFDSNGEISENQVNILVDLYMKNAKAGKEAGGGDPFWDKSEKAFLTALIYYVLENDNIPKKDKCFGTILQKVQMAKVSDDDKAMSPLTKEMYDWFVEVGIMTYNDSKDIKNEVERYKETGEKTRFKTKLYYDTFLIAPQKTANTILITTAVDLQIFSTKQVDFITRTDYTYPENNIDIDTIATQQSYLFLGIPQSHQAYNFLIAMLYSQLYGRLYELGERKIRGKYHIGYKFGTPVFAYCDSEEEAKDFYEHISKECIVEKDYLNGTKMYSIAYKGKDYKHSVLKEPLEKFIDEIDKMYIWNGDEFAGGDPSLPIHINFLLDEFKNIGEIPNFLTILSTSRKYRIGSHCVIQDIGQIKTMYKDGEHETLIANVDTIIFLGSNLKEDKEEIQKMLGKTTIRQKSTSSSNSGLSTSYAPTEVDLMSIDEIAAINQDGRDDEIVIIRDVKPYLCRKLNLTEHKRWKDVQAVKEKKIDAALYYRNDIEEGFYKN